MIRSHILEVLVQLTAHNATEAEMDRASRALERSVAAERAEQLRLYCTDDELGLLTWIVRFCSQHDRVPTLQEFQEIAEQNALNGSKLLHLYLRKCRAEQYLQELNDLQLLAPLLRLSTLSAVMEEMYKELLR